MSLLFLETKSNPPRRSSLTKKWKSAKQKVPMMQRKKKNKMKLDYFPLSFFNFPFGCKFHFLLVLMNVFLQISEFLNHASQPVAL